MINLNILETDYQETITTFILNTMLHNIGMIWMIEDNEDLKYDMELKTSYWIIGGPWYNTSIYKKLYRKLLELFIINTITDRYNIMCSLGAYEIENQSSICDDGNNGGSFSMP